MKSSVGLGLLLALGFALYAVEGTSPPYNPENEARAKADYCQSQKDLKPKLPQKYHTHYDHVINQMCINPEFKVYDMFQYLESKFNKDERTEIHVITNGKENYCSFILGLERLYRIDNGPSEEAPDNISAPEYGTFKSTCNDPTKTLNDIIPLAQTLAQTYQHF